MMSVPTPQTMWPPFLGAAGAAPWLPAEHDASSSPPDTRAAPQPTFSMNSRREILRYTTCVTSWPTPGPTQREPTMRGSGDQSTVGGRATRLVLHPSHAAVRGGAGRRSDGRQWRWRWSIEPADGWMAAAGKD